MPAGAPTAIARAVRRQLRRLRWRWNGREVLRASARLALVLVVTALGTAIAAMTLSPRAFAVVGSALIAGAGAGSVVALSVLCRRWLSTAGAPTWVDGRARLQGRVATLLAFSRRATSDHELLGLLAWQNETRLPEWAPRRLVPHVVPRRDVTGALLAMLALLLVWALAPLVRPPLPGPGGHGHAGAAPDANGPADTRASRDVARGETLSALVRRAATVQARIVDELWGSEWRRAVEAAAPDAESPDDKSVAQHRQEAEPNTTTRRASAGGSADQDARSMRGMPGARAEGVAASDAMGDRRAPRDATPPGPTDESAPSGVQQPARGAGTGTNAQLFGPSDDVLPPGEDRFAVGLAADVHAPRAGSRPPSGEPPPTEEDRHPSVAARQRAARAVLRPLPPAAYEPLVRELYHRGGAAP